ncbi:hypothetical protein BZA05DRAFT_412832 [Tricharina praecox]|uniref:uncharacterized protein n=1 Tax=Tricharina praecox TaxID=43433 RepID=UPI0022212296|nr:uncharacterized protein BZA05DRAFT_412832 [Tricharina praecox]KAI5841719.1 hypothetical protein BZA05DRAFT_412832 [Tricharina praecox]
MITYSLKPSPWRWCLAIALLFGSLATSVIGGPLMNLTVTVPSGSTTYGRPGLICVPTDWKDIVQFLLLNYVSHVASLRFGPWQSFTSSLFSCLVSLCSPFYGIIMNLDVLFRCAISSKDPLERAALAEALCVVCRNDKWRPSDGQVIENARLIVSNSASTGNTVTFKVAHNNRYRDVAVVARVGNNVHGVCELPEGYALICIHRATVIPTGETTSNKITLSSEYNIPKIIAAIFQTVFGSFTLYRARGIQVDRYGYAAFGLTVFPYILMSLVNLAIHLVTPSYPSIYLVHSPEMDEARDRGGIFEGYIGKVIPRLYMHAGEALGGECSGKFKLDKAGNPSGRFIFRVHGAASCASTGDSNDDASIPLAALSTEGSLKDSDAIWTEEIDPTTDAAAILLVPMTSPFEVGEGRRFWGEMRNAAPLRIVALIMMILCFLPMLLLTRFEKRESTVPQRFWTLFWLTFNALWIVSSIIWSRWWIIAVVFFISPVAFIGGLTVVCQMLEEHGSCIRV